MTARMSIKHTFTWEFSCPFYVFRNLDRHVGHDICIHINITSSSWLRVKAPFHSTLSATTYRKTRLSFARGVTASPEGAVIDIERERERERPSRNVTNIMVLPLYGSFSYFLFTCRIADRQADRFKPNDKIKYFWSIGQLDVRVYATLSDKRSKHFCL